MKARAHSGIAWLRDHIRVIADLSRFVGALPTKKCQTPVTASELLDLYDQLMLNDVNFSTYPAEMVLRAFLREYIEEQDQHKIAKT